MWLNCLRIFEFPYHRHCRHHCPLFVVCVLFCFGPDLGALEDAVPDHGPPEALCEHRLAFLVLFLGLLAHL